MTTPNDRWAEKAREIVGIQYLGLAVHKNIAIRIADALHSAEKEGVRRGMERSAQIADVLMVKTKGLISAASVAKVLREEANKESL